MPVCPLTMTNTTSAAATVALLYLTPKKSNLPPCSRFGILYRVSLAIGYRKTAWVDLAIRRIYWSAYCVPRRRQEGGNRQGRTTGTRDLSAARVLSLSASHVCFCRHLGLVFADQLSSQCRTHGCWQLLCLQMPSFITAWGRSLLLPSFHFENFWGRIVIGLTRVTCPYLYKYRSTLASWVGCQGWPNFGHGHPSSTWTVWVRKWQHILEWHCSLGVHSETGVTFLRRSGMCVLFSE